MVSPGGGPGSVSAGKIVQRELSKLVMLVGSDPSFMQNNAESREFHARFTRCVSECERMLQKRDVGFISDLLSVVIRCLRWFGEKMEPSEVGCMPFLCLFNLLSVIFTNFIGPVFSEQCRIFGLQSAAGQHMNGLVVTAMAFDVASGRFCVRLKPTDSKKDWKKIKPENLEMCRSEVSSSQQGAGLDSYLNQAVDTRTNKSNGSGSTVSKAPMKNTMGLNCLESIADVFDYILKEVVYLAEGKEAILARLTCRAMWRTLTSCIGGVQKLSGADFLELCGNETFYPCLLAKSVLSGESEIARPLSQLWDAVVNVQGATEHGPPATQIHHSNDTKTSKSTNYSNFEAKINVDDGKLTEVVNFRNKLAQSFIDTDLLAELNRNMRAAVTGERVEDTIPEPAQLRLGSGNPHTMMAMVSQILEGRDGANYNGTGQPSSVHVQRTLLQATSKSIIEICNACLKGDTQVQQRIKRHLLLHAKDYLDVVQRHVLKAWFEQQMNLQGTLNGTQQFDGDGGYQFQAGTNPPVSNLGAVDNMLISHILESLLRLKLTLPHICGGIWVPPYAPYLKGIGARLSAKCVMLELQETEYTVQEGRHPLLEKIRNAEGQVCFGLTTREKILYYKMCRQFLSEADPHSKNDAEPYWITVFNNIIADLHRVGTPHGDGDQGWDQHWQNEWGEDWQDEFEGEEEALKRSAEMYENSLAFNGDVSEEALLEELGTYYEEQQAILNEIIAARSNENSPEPAKKGDDDTDQNPEATCTSYAPPDTCSGPGMDGYAGLGLPPPPPPMDDPPRGPAPQPPHPEHSSGMHGTHSGNMNGMLGHGMPGQNCMMPPPEHTQQISSAFNAMAPPAYLSPNQQNRDLQQDQGPNPLVDQNYVPQGIRDPNSPSVLGNNDGNRILGDLPTLQPRPQGFDPMAPEAEKQNKGLSRERLLQIGISLDSADVPQHLRCEIDGKIMGQPVRSPSGHVFEKSTLEKWLLSMGQVCPVSGDPLALDHCKREKALEKQIAEYVNALKKKKKKEKKQLEQQPIPNQQYEEVS